MHTPTVAVWTLAALAALDLVPQGLEFATSSALPSDSSLSSDRQPDRPLGQPAQATQAVAIARPELSTTQLSTSLAAGASGNYSGDRPLRSVRHSNRSVDLEGHWAEPLITSLQQQGVVQGFADGTFRPDASIQPDHFVGLVRRAVNKYGTGFLLNYANQLLAGQLPSGQGLSEQTISDQARSHALGLATQLLSSPGQAAVASASNFPRLTRAEAVALVYQALAQAEIVPSIAVSVPPRSTLVASAAGAGFGAAPAKQGTGIAENTAEKANQPKLKVAADTAAIPTAAIPTAAIVQLPPDLSPVAMAQQVAEQVTEYITEQVTEPVTEPVAKKVVGQVAEGISEPETVAESGKVAEKVAEKAPEVSSQLGKLVTGNQSKNFLEYWSSLCQADSQTLEAAIAACDQLLTQKPREASLWATRGQLLAAGNQFAEAVASFDRALSLSPPTSDLHLRRAQALLANNKPETALAASEQAIQLDKSWGQQTPAIAWYVKGTALKRLGRNADASAALERSLALQPNNSEVWSEQCRVLSELGQNPAAVATCDRALAVNANWGGKTPAIAWSNRALALTRMQQFPTAVAAYEQAIAANPQDATLWTKQGIVLSQLGQHTQALLSFDRALKLSPNNALALVNRATTLNKLGQYEAALAVSEQALGSDDRREETTLGDVWDQRSIALAGLGKLEEALAAADRAVTVKPKSAEAWSNRAVVLWRMKQYAVALASVERAVSLQPNYTQGWFNKGRILRTMERYPDAIAAYDRALQGDINPNNTPTLADIWANRSAVQWRLGQFSEALKSTDQAIGIDPKSSLAWYNRGGVLMALQKPQEATTAYTQATQLAPTDAFAWIGKGLALERSGRLQDAIVALDAALQIDPSQTLAQQSRSNLLAKLTKSTGKPSPKNQQI